MWIGRKLGEKENKRNLSEKKSRENKDGERIERKKKIRKGIIIIIIIIYLPSHI